MNVECRIMIEKPKTGFLLPDGEIKGIIHFVVNKLPGYKYVIKSLIGRAGSFWSHPRSAYTYTSIYTCTMYAAVNIFEEQPEEEVIVEHEYDYRFAFRLHRSDLTSIKIWYRSVWIPNDCDKMEIPHNGFLNYIPFSVKSPFYILPSNFFRIEKKIFPRFGINMKSLIKFEVKMEQNMWIPGEYGKMIYIINNRASVDILSVETNFYNICIGFNKEETRISFIVASEVNKRDLKNEECVVRIPGGTKSQLYVEYPIPDNIRTTLISRFEFRVKLKLPMLYRNITATIPVFIGKKEDFPPIDFSEKIEDIEWNKEVKEYCSNVNNSFMNQYFKSKNKLDEDDE